MRYAVLDVLGIGSRAGFLLVEKVVDFAFGHLHPAIDLALAQPCQCDLLAQISTQAVIDDAIAIKCGSELGK